jgi:CubicO group peptidase (beta-lactamase class C family)
MRHPQSPALKSAQRLGVIAVAALMIAAVPGATVADEQAAPPWPTAGWQASTPEEQGIDPGALAALVEEGATQNLDSMLIIRHGRIVLDAYYAPYSAALPHVVNSVTKALTGTLAAIALKDGLLQSPDQAVMPFFADHIVTDPDTRKSAITLQTLFDMTSGLDWQEPFGGVPRSMIDMDRSRNQIDFVLNRPMADAPGERFNYNSGGTHLVSAIVAKVTGMTTEAYAAAKLFGPLGITAWTWRRDPQGISTGGYGLVLHPYDMAKFGYLYLRGGVWDGQQVVPAEWVDKVNHAVVDMHTSFAPELRYANFFWAVPERHIYWASGYHCQLVIVYPALDLVAVTTGKDECRVRTLTTAIAQSVKSATALSPDGAGSERLAQAIRVAAIEKPSAVNAPPPVAAAVSGKVYRFAGNLLGLKSLSLSFEGADPHYVFDLYTRNPSQPPEKVSGALGLDGLYRRGADTPFGPLAVKGRWLDDRSFEIDRINLGAGEMPRRWTLTFDGDRLDLHGRNFLGEDVSVTGTSGG